METSPKIVKLLFKNLELLVQIFGALEDEEISSIGEANQIPDEQKNAEGQ